MLGAPILRFFLAKGARPRHPCRQLSAQTLSLAQKGWFSLMRAICIYIRHQMMLILVHGDAMRTTLALDDDLVSTAQEYTGLVEKTALVREALKSLIQREAARRLAALGGTMPELKDIPCRRPE